MSKITVRHCYNCGGSGWIYEDVPGTLIEGNGIVTSTESRPPLRHNCTECEGTGHIISEVRE